MKILLIKLGAMGDVLRTTPLLLMLKKRYPDVEITWLVDAKSAPVLQKNPFIDRLWVLSPARLGRLADERFDLAANLDKDEEALEAMTRAVARQKAGFGLSPDGKLCALDEASDYAYRLGIDDELKFRKNRKTYQQISFEQLGFHFNKQEYVFTLEDRHTAQARRFLKKIGLDVHYHDHPWIGLNTGSGPRFAGKKLPVESYIALARRLNRDLGASVILLGGEDEVARNREIGHRLGTDVLNGGTHPIKEFAAIVRECDLVISGDTIAMHIAIAVRVPVVAFFASTCAQEIEIYGRGRKIVSTIDCSPCYKRDCPIDEQCMKDMPVDTLFGAAKEVLAKVTVS